MHFNCLPFHKLSINQLYAILKLRQEVFIVEQNCPYLDADGHDQDALHLMGFVDHQLVAYTRLVPKGLSYKEYPSIGRVITSKKIRGEGFGRLLMTTSIENLHNHWGEQTIKISAQSHLVPFYNTLHFESTGEEYLEDGIPHTAMLYKL